MIRRVNAEPAIGLGAGRALLLQLANPAVAAGVHDHSDFKRNPFKRLLGTLEAMYGVVFGSEELADGIGRRVQWIHTFVVGPGYTANDPAHLLWVHATLYDTARRNYERFVEPLTDADLATYYEQMATVAVRFGCPREAQPSTPQDFERWFEAAVAAMVVSDTGRDLGGFILEPELPLRLHVPLRPLLRFQRLLTVGSLPATLRAQFGFAWSPDDEVRLARATRRLRTLFGLTPRPVRTLGARVQGVFLLGLAHRHLRAFDARAAISGG